MILRRFKPPKKESYFLFGPRGTGKTTWLRKEYPKGLWVDLLNSEEERKFSMHPELLKELVLAHSSSVVVIDEVQKVPDILDVVHELIEMKQGWQFILTGSSSRKLRRSGVNLMAGRALWKHFHAFTFQELGKKAQLDQVLETGLIPLVWGTPSPQEKLRAYVNLYLQEEIKAEVLVRNIGDFFRFSEIFLAS